MTDLGPRLPQTGSRAPPPAAQAPPPRPAVTPPAAGPSQPQSAPPGAQTRVPALAKPGGRTAKEETPALELDAETLTAGREGQRALGIEPVNVWVSGHRPCLFIVQTTPGHSLTGSVEQLWYRKSYTGTSSIQTDVIPIAPIGTKTRVLATDVDTGEVIDRTYLWRPLGRPSWLGRLAKRIAGLFTNSS